MSNQIDRQLVQQGSRQSSLSYSSIGKSKGMFWLSLGVFLIYILLANAPKGKAADLDCNTDNVQEVPLAVADSNGDNTVFVHKVDGRSYLCEKLGTEAMQILVNADAPWNFSDVVWSNDNTKVAVVLSNESQGVGRTESYLYIIDLKAVNTDTNPVTPFGVIIAEQPVWSPDDQYLAFSGATKSNDFDIYVIETYGGTVVAVVGNSGEADREPSWFTEKRLSYVSLPSHSYGKLVLP